MIERLVHDRLDVDLRHKSLLLSGNIDHTDPDGGMFYVTEQAAAEVREALRPYIQQATKDQAERDAEADRLNYLASRYLSVFGNNNSQNTGANT